MVFGWNAQQGSGSDDTDGWRNKRVPIMILNISDDVDKERGDKESSWVDISLHSSTR